MIGDTDIFRKLCDIAEVRGAYVELHAGGFAPGTVERRELSRVVVASGPKGKRRMLTERRIIDGRLDEAAAGCLGFLDGTVA